MVSDIDALKEHSTDASTVLILVVMEYGLRQMSERIAENEKNDVLILVVMEYGLRQYWLTVMTVV